MTTAHWILADLATGFLCAAFFIAAATAAGLRRPRSALALLAAALATAVVHVGCVFRLAEAGWWFVEEKVLLGLPLLVFVSIFVAGLVGPRLAGREPGGQPQPDALAVTALSIAGYAALAGPVITLVGGYPLTWAKGLAALAMVSLAGGLTHRVVAGAPTPRSTSARTERTPTLRLAQRVEPEADAVQLSRRRVLALSSAAAVGAVVPFGSTTSARNQAAGVSIGVATTGAPGAATTSVASLRGELTAAPGGVMRRHRISARQTVLELSSGASVDAWTYGGQVPGPAITAVQGDLLEVVLHNEDIPDGVTLHWHGYDVACGEDGAPGTTQDTVRRGEDFTYRFRANQVGTYWYHTHHASHVGVRKGLYGTLVVHPRSRRSTSGQQEATEPLDLLLPIHTLAGSLMIAGAEGPADQTVTAGRPVRLRFVNADSTTHRVTVDGTAFRVAAVDGRDLHQPAALKEIALRIPAGGRRDVTFDMPDTDVVVLIDDRRQNGVRLLRDADPSTESSMGSSLPTADTSIWPELDLLHYGTAAPLRFDPRRTDRRFTVVLDRGAVLAAGRPRFAQTVNGRSHPEIPDQRVAEGELVGLTLINRSFETHPWHLHGHAVLVISRDGEDYTGSPVWVDSLDVEPGQVWDVVFEATNPGIWMNHCHNLVHAHEGMMLRLAYDGVHSPFGATDHGHGGHG